MRDGGTATGLRPAQVERLYARVTARLIPFLFVCYLFAYLDRVNVGFAKLRMSADLGFSETVYGLGAGIFFIGYFFFEVPSNLLLHRFGARLALSRIMILWGLLSAAMALTEDAASFYLLRFLLGVAEAGFFPGVILYLTYWYPAARRGRVTALFATAVAFSSVVGAPLSGYVMESLQGVGAFEGWQWLFILEGLPSVVLGGLTLVFLADNPGTARWLTPEERDHLEATVGADQARVRHQSLRAGLGAPVVWLLAANYFSLVLGLYGLNFWLPTLIRERGFEDLSEIGWISAIPFGAAMITMVIIGRSADRRDERRWHVILPTLVGTLGLLLSCAPDLSPRATILALTVAACGILSALPQTWSISTGVLGGGAAATGIAVINSVGNLSGFVGPYAIGWLKDTTGSFTPGMLLIGAFQVLSAGLVWWITRSGWRAPLS